MNVKTLLTSFLFIVLNLLGFYSVHAEDYCQPVSVSIRATATVIEAVGLIPVEDSQGVIARSEATWQSGFSENPNPLDPLIEFNPLQLPQQEDYPFYYLFTGKTELSICLETENSRIFYQTDDTGIFDYLSEYLSTRKMETSKSDVPMTITMVSISN